MLLLLSRIYFFNSPHTITIPYNSRFNIKVQNAIFLSKYNSALIVDFFIISKEIAKLQIAMKNNNRHLVNH